MTRPGTTARQQFGQHLREHRAALGLPAKQVAKTLKVDPAQVSRWERGAQLPNPKRIGAIAKTLKVDPLELATKLTAAAMEDNAQLARDNEQFEQEHRAIHVRLDRIEDTLRELLRLSGAGGGPAEESEDPVEVGLDRC